MSCQACNSVQQNVARSQDGLPCDASDHSGTMSWKALDWAIESDVGEPHQTLSLCGHCEDEGSRTITVALSDGTEAAVPAVQSTETTTRTNGGE